ncbi:MAG: Ig-like domain-containing protein [Gemmatimonadetes bacterium]|nr:Ig-like domain-containing protein [Gemmatimonadota bacterium]
MSKLCRSNSASGYLFLLGIVAVLSFLVLVTCGKDSPTRPSQPTQPTAPTPTPTPTPPQPTRITITPSTATPISIGQTVQLAASVLDQNGQPVSGAVVTWLSNNANVATVSSQGLVTAVGNGSATITARSGSVSQNASVTVRQSVGSITIEPAMATLMSIGETVQLTASVLDENGQPVSGAVVDWSSGDETVATVSDGGLVTAVVNGTATITATAGGVSATAAITVLVPQIDRDILVAFYESAGGEHWTVKTNWKSVHRLNSWYGVTVDADGRVVEINLPNNNLRGTITTELGNLEELVTLRLNHNQLTGHVPQDLGRLSKLEHLALSSNQLSGVIPSELGQLAELDELVLSFNRLSGTIPAELGDLAGLTRLSLSVNELSGPIPGGLGRLRQLTSLRLDQNRLSGPIPLAISGLTELQSLVLADNRLTGAIPPGLSMLDDLSELVLDHNQLEGQIPGDLGRLDKLKRLGLAGNRLSGSAPSELGQLANLTRLHLFSNPGLSGILPRSYTRLPLEELLLEGTRLCVPPDGGYEAWLAQIAVKTVTTCADLESSALATLYNATNGHNWNDHSNWLSDRPLRTWYGVTTDAAGRVTRIDLANNNLSGSVPAELAGLSKLNSLDLSSNGFLRGPLPRELINLELQELQLADTRLCTPPDTEFQEWLRTIPARRVSSCDDFDLNTFRALFALFNSANGPEWTDRTNWNSDAPLGEWYGITTNANGRITELNLAGNNLSGSIPLELAELTDLERVDFSDNEGLTGPLPREWTKLGLEYLWMEGTQMCAPPDPGFQAWLDEIPEYSILDCADTRPEGADNIPDWDVLELLYHSMNGKDWTNSENWLSEAPLDQWYGVTADEEGQVTALDLEYNNLSGELPPGLGDLTGLALLNLSRNSLSGPIPAELGQLTSLEQMNLAENNLSGEIPSELGQLTGLRQLSLGDNALSGGIPAELRRMIGLQHLDFGWNYRLTGEIPAELGQLTRLKTLWLKGNMLSGVIPSELGQLTSLEQMDLAENNLSGEIPSELGQLTSMNLLDLRNNNLAGSIPAELGQLTGLSHLHLHSNDLSGSIPRELGRLTSLSVLDLSSNPLLSGPLTESITTLPLGTLRLGNTALCVPRTPPFQIWLQSIQNHRAAFCLEFTSATAYMTQATQSFTHPVPLVAGKPALLRVFITGGSDPGASMPPVQAVFFNDNQIVHSVEIPAQDAAVPAQIEEGALMYSANAEVPGTVVSPGLEMVVNIDPAGTIVAESEAAMRIPESGRQSLDVRTVPPFYLTMVPFLWMESPDIGVLADTDGLTSDDDLFWQTRNLLPIADFEVEVREPVWTATDPVIYNSNDVLRETKAIRALDGSDRYYLGILRAGGGQAELPGTSSVSDLDAEVIAHEIGHNLSLFHAPCGGAGGPDPHYPYDDGAVGSWGYDFRDGTLVAPGTADLMSYCHPQWISEYGFTRAMHHRGTASRLLAAAGFPRKGLLVWGGVNEEGELELEPGFVVDSAPSVPSRSGPYRLAGLGADGSVLFSADFGMPELGDGPGNAFAFVLPVQSGWSERLYRIVLSGPEGVVSTERDGDRSAALLLDRDTGRVRGLLRDWLDPTGVSPRARPMLPEPGLEIVVSPGVPDPESW